MNDPSIHLNRTLKAYINNRLNKNFSTENIQVKASGEMKIQNEITNEINNKCSIFDLHYKTFLDIIK